MSAGAEASKFGSILSRSVAMIQFQRGPATWHVATSPLFQLKVLSTRFTRTWLRSPVNLLVQLAQYMSLALLIGAPNPLPSPKLRQYKVGPKRKEEEEDDNDNQLVIQRFVEAERKWKRRVGCKQIVTAHGR